MLLWNSPGFAATEWDLVYAPEFDSSSRTQRRDVAADLSRRIGVLINQMPEQRPRELARLRNKEDNIAEANNRERSAFYESTAYQHRFLAQLLTKIVQDLHCAATEQSVSAEMACSAFGLRYAACKMRGDWTKTSTCRCTLRTLTSGTSPTGAGSSSTLSFPTSRPRPLPDPSLHSSLGSRSSKTSSDALATTIGKVTRPPSGFPYSWPLGPVIALLDEP
jgi:hypothetical protein